MTPLLDIRNLDIRFGETLAAVRGASLQIAPGETHCLVGESGCGKSVTALSILQLLGRRARVDADCLTFRGHDLRRLSPAALSRIAGNEIAMIFQEPMTSLNPAFTVGSQMVEGYLRHRGGSRAAAMDRAEMLLGRVGITAPAMRLAQFPHQLSGGLRQRVMIAMALMCEPALLIADEPTTALDVTVQAQILRLLAQLQQETGLAILLITHDLGVVARIADRVSVMYAGAVVETGPADMVFAAPEHPYSRGLMACIPVPGRLRPGEDLGSIPGTVPRLPPGFRGCGFRDRCAKAGTACAEAVAMRPAMVGHLVRCTLESGWMASEMTPA